MWRRSARRSLGLKTALVESQHLGGICLNWGCIPTKALLRSAEIYNLINHADEFGIKVKGAEIDFKKVIERSRAVAKQLSGGIGHLMKKNKVTVFDGFGKLLGGGKVAVEKDGKAVDQMRRSTLLSRPARGRGRCRGWSRTASWSGRIKRRWCRKKCRNRFWSSVLAQSASSSRIFTVCSAWKLRWSRSWTAFLPVEDEEISALARKAFEKQGMKILTGAKVTKLDKSKNNVKATIDVAGKTQEITVDRVIMAVGIVGNTENMGLEKLKVKIDKGFIVTDEWLKTGEPNVYAIGDVAGPPMLAHKASHEGVICVEKIAGQKDVHPMKKTNIPGCTYCMPQVASVGLTEKAARDKGLKIKVGKFPFIGNGKAIALGEPEGMIKTIFDEKTGELLGAHMIGAEVTELIQGYVIAKTLETTEAELMHTIFAHPTLSEMMHESVLSAYGKAIHF
jgi:dihydrolipoamide dehydrogenase